MLGKSLKREIKPQRLSGQGKREREKKKKKKKEKKDGEKKREIQK